MFSFNAALWKSRLLPLLALVAVLASAPPTFATDATQPSPPIPVPVTPPARSEVLDHAQTKLAWELIQHLSSARSDPLVSPASLASVFAVLGEGASPTMQDAIAKTLGFAESERQQAMSALMEARTQLTAANGGTFQSVDRIAFPPDAPPNPEVQAKLEKLGVVFSAEDLSKPEAVAKIDAWVKDITKGAIPEILGGPLGKGSFVALNALHFKGRWKAPFDRRLTAPAPFVGVDGKRSDADMMRLTMEKRAYRADKTFVGVDLPFSDDRFSLVVVTSLEKPLSIKEFDKAASWLDGASFESRLGDLALPRFKLSGREELLAPLDALGLEPARRSPTALAGFGASLRLSQVLQRTEIEVDEEGAEAAAATAVMATKALVVDNAIHMNVDKPFIFALRDQASGMILAAGYVGHLPRPR
jgi:serine protease inhibitor